MAEAAKVEGHGAKITDEGIAKIRTRIGQGFPGRRPWRTEASADAIYHLAYAIGDLNPLYIDPEYAEKSRWGRLVAPPIMIQSMDTLRAVGHSGLPEGLPGVHSIWSGCHYEWERPLLEGDRTDMDVVSGRDRQRPAGQKPRRSVRQPFLRILPVERRRHPRQHPRDAEVAERARDGLRILRPMRPQDQPPGRKNRAGPGIGQGRDILFQTQRAHPRFPQLFSETQVLRSSRNHSTTLSTNLGSSANRHTAKTSTSRNQSRQKVAIPSRPR